MRILVYGGTGYIGKKLIEYLISLNYVVGNVSRRESSIDDVKNFSYEADIESIVTTFCPDSIIYMAACCDNEKLLDILEVNIKKPLEILNLFRTQKNIKFIYIGSYWQFGDANKPNVPIDLYSASKKAIVPFLDYYDNYTANTCIEIVLYGTYGEDDKRGKLLDYLLTLCKQEEIAYLTDGFQELNMVNVADVCIAIERIINLKEGRKFQILSDKTYTPRDIVHVIQKNHFFNVKFGFKNYRSVELMKLFSPPDYEKIIIKDSVESYIKKMLNDTGAI